MDFLCAIAMCGTEPMVDMNDTAWHTRVNPHRGDEPTPEHPIDSGRTTPVCWLCDIPDSLLPPYILSYMSKNGHEDTFSTWTVSQTFELPNCDGCQTSQRVRNIHKEHGCVVKFNATRADEPSFLHEGYFVLTNLTTNAIVDFGFESDAMSDSPILVQDSPVEIPESPDSDATIPYEVACAVIN
jgi:hypothetical protein